MGYNGTYVSLDGTHHLKEGLPLYERRFSSVQSFHEPGIAPVEDETGCHFIDMEGKEVFGKKFVKAYGFYEGLAAVKDASGWYHIDLRGKPVYDTRFDWVGNFHEGLCTVRDMQGYYYHILQTGKPAYTARYRYAGDYRYGIAVVFENAGKAYHILRDGSKVHGSSYADLDVFHKGFARAKDGCGWTHIDQNGKNPYPEHFAMVEPFYNGQARVQDWRGWFKTIDESGKTIHTIGPVIENPFADLNVLWEDEIHRSSKGALYPIKSDSGRELILKSSNALNLYITEANILHLLQGKRWTPELVDCFESQGFGYIVMEKRQGKHLGPIRKCHKYDKEVISAFFIEMLQYLAELHSLGYVHSDLHPENILMDVSGENMILTILDHEHAQSLNDQETEIHWGIWEFIPPEQLGPRGRVDERSDLYSLGALILSMFTGAAPVRIPKPSSKKVHRKIRETIIANKENLPHEMPAECPYYEIVLQMLDPDPEKRPASAMDIIRRMEEFI
ncbi:MAG: hypothetical protein PWQ63_717 [Methanolobus sp.]|nr:hypothetical protein [Methanolobus sp.]